MTITAPETARPEEFEQIDSESPETGIELNETPAELAARLQAEVVAQTNGLVADVLPSTQHSIDVIGPDPEIDQQPEMVALMAELEQYIEEARVLGKMTEQQLAATITDEGQVKADESPTMPTEDQNDTPESEPLRETPETVKQLLDSWKTSYDTNEDPDLKAELAYRMVKMGEALRASRLNANEVGIQELNGAAGFYRFDTKETFLTPAGLDTPEHFKQILVHEAVHGGKFTGRRIADEGLTEIATQKRAPDAGGVYEKEQAQIRNAFTKFDIPSVLNSYDFDHPEELITLYLQTEWKDAWAKIRNELQPGEDVLTENGRLALLQGRLRGWAVSLEDNLKSGLPDLVGKAKNNGLNFDQIHAQLFQKMVDAEISATKRMEVDGKQTV